ncbi:hypothetical protein [Microbacterium sp. cx-59]|uniref:hypothetical protein n=1 Tax=Microbacterium sp. cx-59 TaxID=2891207 RepID=UPI001E5F641D|nr:hypothetical protein [Microbacterium sp. cx-59]MCC4909450.1 hypothetical protein [Microbacterium sp. cx-59]
MGDAITISSGGGIAVDTAALDAAAAVLASAADELHNAATQFVLCEHRIPALFLGIPTSPALVASRLSETGGRADELAGALRAASATYTLVELRVAYDVAIAAGDEAGAADAQRAIDTFEAQHPDAVATADAALDAARAAGDGPVLDAFWGGLPLWVVGVPVVSLIGMALAQVRSSGQGTVAAGTRVAPGGTAANLVPLPVSQNATAPRTLADAAARIPASGDARVRIEQYVRAGGGRTFAVYVTGTRSMSGADPWDMTSNVQSFTGHRSDALATVEAALVEAGAEPGDEVLGWGHSQGGMSVGQLAQTGVYDMQVVGTFGSPTSVDVGADTLSVQVRHTDDPVASLAVGHPDRVGAEQSFLVERTVDETGGLHDLTLPAHHLETYVQTAEAADASGDPRVIALHDRLSELADAELVEVREYGAERDTDRGSFYPQSSTRNRP